MTTQPAQTINIDGDIMPQLVDFAERLREVAPPVEHFDSENMRRLWRQEVAVREAEIALAHAKAMAKGAKSALDEELAKLRGMVAEFSDPAQLA